MEEIFYGEVFNILNKAKVKKVKQKIKFKKKAIPVYEHLEHHVKNTTYSHRWKLLQQMSDFIRLAQKAKLTPARSK